MKKYNPAHPAIEHALNLDGDPETIKAYYAEWAESYDQDVLDNYTGPRITAQLLHEHLDKTDRSVDKTEFTIADVGCGTGLVGIQLQSLEFQTFDGMDISQEMVDKAEELGVYRNLYGDIDMNQPLKEEWIKAYDAVLCCGVFTLGHVPASMLKRLIEMAKPKGIVVTSTRTSYYDSTDYQQVSDAIQTNRSATLVKLLKDAPYTGDGDAHYWIYQSA